MLKVKVVNKSNNMLPEYATIGSAGLDLRAYIEDGVDIVLKPFERKLIHTGLYVELPVGYELRVQPRSGLALKNGISVLNSPGCVDSDYRGEIGVILINLSKDDFVIHNGDRIAQAIVSSYEQVEFVSVERVEELSKTERGDGGFSHTGVK